MRHKKQKMTVFKRWSSDQTEQFVKGYESLPCLWDPANTNYTNKKMREDAYKRLAAMMDMDEFGLKEVKAKIKSIRNTYALELIKLKNNRGKSDKNKVFSRLSWFSVADNFLRDIVHVKSENVELNETVIKREPRGSNSHSVSPVPQQTSEAVKRKRESSMEDNNKLSSPYRHQNNLSYRQHQEYPNKNNYRSLHAQRSRDEDDNEYDVFGKSVACQLKKLPEMMAQESMANIQTYFFKQRFKARKLKKKRRHVLEDFDPIEVGIDVHNNDDDDDDDDDQTYDSE